MARDKRLIPGMERHSIGRAGCGNVNGKGKTWEERARELLEEQASERFNLPEWVKRRLGWEDWERLEPAAARFARKELKRRRRKNSGEVLPGGYDVESIAAQAITDLLEGKGRLAPGWTGSRLVREVERLIRRRVRLLASLKEARAPRYELDAEQPDSEESATEAVLLVPDECRDGCGEMMEREAEERRERLGGDFEKFLAGEPELTGLFRCLCAGITKPAVIAGRLGIPESRVAAMRKKLERRIARFRKTHAC
jgi:hypothetical protein